MGQERTRYFTQYMGDLDANENSKEKVVWVPDVGGKLTAAKITTDAAVNKADTNYNTYAIKNGSTSMATIANGPNSAAGTTTVAGTFSTMTLSTTLTNRAFSSGDVITIEPTKTGNGLAWPGACICLQYEVDD